MEFFVSPAGDAENPGTQALPFRSIPRGLPGALPASKLQAGDVLTLRDGVYLEAVLIESLAGKPGQEITIRSFSGERAVIDSSLPAFRTANNNAWTQTNPADPAQHPDEWVSTAPLPSGALPMVGAFLDPPYRRLVSYSTDRDFRADNQTFDKIFNVDPPDLTRSPWKVVNEK